MTRSTSQGSNDDSSPGFAAGQRRGRHNEGAHPLIAQAHIPPTELVEVAGFAGTAGTIGPRFDQFDDGASARELCPLIPIAVPSGLPILHFQGCPRRGN